MNKDTMKSLLVWKRILQNERISFQDIVGFLKGYIVDVEMNIKKIKDRLNEYGEKIKKNRDYIQKNNKNMKLLKKAIDELVEKIE